MLAGRILLYFKVAHHLDDDRTDIASFRKFFPPTDHDLSGSKSHERQTEQQQTHEGELLASLPDAPSAEPKPEGHPDAKEQKLGSDPTDDGWEAVEKPSDEADDEDMVTVTKNDVEAAIGPHSSAPSGVNGKGSTVQSGLLKDW